jgi:homopolymeric O-antigen transport system permease protein
MLNALWRYRGFILGMVARELRSRYVHSILGGAWAILNPLAMIAIYTVIFSGIMQARLPGLEDRLGYSLYLCAGLLPWMYFAEVLTRSQTVFLQHATLLKNVSFPRISLPVILLLSSTVNFAITFALFLAFLAATQRFPGWEIIAFLPLLALQQALALGLGILLGTINVFYRDVAHVVGVGLQFWFWFTPIVYSVDILPARAQRVFALNPMSGLVAAYQGIIVHHEWPQWERLQLSIALTLILMAVGFFTFHRLSGEMVDEI